MNGHDNSKVGDAEHYHDAKREREEVFQKLSKLRKIDLRELGSGPLAEDPDYRTFHKMGGFEQLIRTYEGDGAHFKVELRAKLGTPALRQPDLSDLSEDERQSFAEEVDSTAKGHVIEAVIDGKGERALRLRLDDDLLVSIPEKYVESEVWEALEQFKGSQEEAHSDTFRTFLG